MSGQTETRADIALPGGDLAEFSGTTLDFYGHADALGSIRAESTPLQKLAAYVAFTPFGEDETSTSGASRIFTGQHQDLSPTTDAGQGQYDFLYREFSPVQARWWTPDPAGLAAVDPGDPQTWNKYAYIRGTPLISADPKGLMCPSGSCAAIDGEIVSILDSYGSGGGCMVNGVDAGCVMVEATISSGAGVQCPHNDCGGRAPYTCLADVCGYMTLSYAYTHDNEWNGPSTPMPNSPRWKLLL